MEMLLCCATGGMLSKHTYTYKVMESAVMNYIQANRDYAVEDYKQYTNRVHCKDCQHLMFSDHYGECSKGYRGIVSPEDSCEHGEKKI